MLQYCHIYPIPAKLHVCLHNFRFFFNTSSHQGCFFFWEGGGEHDQLFGAWNKKKKKFEGSLQRAIRSSPCGTVLRPAAEPGHGQHRRRCCFCCWIPSLFGCFSLLLCYTNSISFSYNECDFFFLFFKTSMCVKKKWLKCCVCGRKQPINQATKTIVSLYLLIALVCGIYMGFIWRERLNYSRAGSYW